MLFVYIALGAFIVGGAVTFVYFFVRDKWFASTARSEAKRIIEEWIREYNTDRLHQELGYLSLLSITEKN